MDTEKNNDIKSFNKNIANERYNNFDLLRIISCIAVIFIHVISKLINNLDNSHIFFVVIVRCFITFSVPCFFMLSGALSIAKQKNKEYKDFYKKTISKIVYPTILFSALYFLFSLFIGLKNHEDIMISLINLFKGVPNVIMWYMYAMIGIYLLVPLIIRFKDAIGDKKYNKISWLYFIIMLPSCWIIQNEIYWSMIVAVQFLTYFMLGYTLNSTTKQKNNKFGIILIAFGMLFALLNSFLVYYFQIEVFLGCKVSLLSWFNPLVAVYSIFMFKGFSYLDIKTSFSKISNLTLYIYLFHIFVLTIIQYFIRIDNILSFVLVSFAVFIISALISHIYIKVKMHFENKYSFISKTSNHIVNSLDKFLGN